jgi:hypothetical protein
MCLRARVSLEPAKTDALEALARQLSVPCTRIGESGGPRMVFGDLFEATVDEARAAFEDAIPKLLAS